MTTPTRTPACADMDAAKAEHTAIVTRYRAAECQGQEIDGDAYERELTDLAHRYGFEDVFKMRRAILENEGLL